MQRGRQRAPVGVEALEAELADLKRRQAELRVKLRHLKTHSTGLSALEAKLEKQLAPARWLAEQIRQTRPDWDEWAFYKDVEPVKPKPRGRRPRVAAELE